MAVKKRMSGSPQAALDVHAFTIVLEDIRSQFAVFGEALQGLREQMVSEFRSVRTELKDVRTEFDGLRTEFGGLRTEFGGLRTEFGGLRSDFEGLRQEFKDHRRYVDERFDAFHAEVARDFGAIRVAVLENSRGLKEVRDELHELRARVDQKVDRDEVLRIVGAAGR